MVLIQGKSIIADDITIADNFYSKLVGLICKKNLDINQGLFLINTNLIHTHFMKFPIAVVYLSSDYRILFIENLSPGKLGKYIKNAKHILEIHLKTGKNLYIGERIVLKEKGAING